MNSAFHLRGRPEADRVRLEMIQLERRRGAPKAYVRERTDAHTLVVDGGRGIEFLIRMVRRGERYGQGNAFLHEDTMPLVEFYDTRWPFNQAPDGAVLGQFIERYTLAALDGASPSTTGRNPAGAALELSEYLRWAINPAGRSRILGFLRTQRPDAVIDLRER